VTPITFWSPKVPIRSSIGVEPEKSTAVVVPLEG